MSGLTTHVLDTARGRPAAGMSIVLEIEDGGAFREVVRAVTNADGRVTGGLLPGERLEAATYRITFDTGAWFRAEGLEGFYPTVPVVFRVAAPEEHHHVPLLVSPYGFSTYRGS